MRPLLGAGRGPWDGGEEWFRRRTAGRRLRCSRPGRPPAGRRQIRVFRKRALVQSRAEHEWVVESRGGGGAQEWEHSSVNIHGRRRRRRRGTGRDCVLGGGGTSSVRAAAAVCLIDLRAPPGATSGVLPRPPAGQGHTHQAQQSRAKDTARTRSCPHSKETTHTKHTKHTHTHAPSTHTSTTPRTKHNE